MKNSIKKLCFTLLVASVFTSCDLGGDKAANYGNGAYVTQFPFAEKTAFFLKDDAVIYDYDVPVELVGGNGLALNQDITLSYELDATENTAVQGVNFDFVNATNNFTIPAGSVFSTIKVKVYSGTLDDQAPPTLAIRLTSATAEGQDVVIAGQKGLIKLVLQGTCTSDLAGLYNNVTTRITPAGGPYTWTNQPITEVDAGTYQTVHTGNYYGQGGDPGTGTTVQLAPAYGGYTFKEVCGRVVVETQNLADYYSNLVKQSTDQYAASSVNPATGVITIEYSIFFTGNTVERKYRSIYTPMP
jgi:hypothetical protein